MSDEMMKGVKAPRKKPAPAPKVEKVKANLSLEVQAYQRLFVASVMGRKSASEIVESLICEHLREWALPANLADRATRRHNSQSVDLAGPVESMAEIAA